MSDKPQTACDHSNTTFSFCCAMNPKNAPIRCDRCGQRVDVREVKKSFAETLEKVKDAIHAQV